MKLEDFDKPTLGDRILDSKWFEGFMTWLLLGALIAMAIALILIPVAWWQSSHEPTFSLSKNQWQCVETARQRQVVLVGRVATVQYHDVCIDYQMKEVQK